MKRKAPKKPRDFMEGELCFARVHTDGRPELNCYLLESIADCKHLKSWLTLYIAWAEYKRGKK